MADVVSNCGSKALSEEIGAMSDVELESLIGSLSSLEEGLRDDKDVRKLNVAMRELRKRKIDLNECVFDDMEDEEDW